MLAENFASIDRIDPVNDDDELNPDGAVMQDDSTKKRSGKLTEKSLCLKKSTLLNKREKMNFKTAETGKCNRRPHVHIQEYGYSSERDCTV